MDISLADLLTQTSLFMHGSTVVNNTILTQETARIGLIATRGLEDTVLMTRGAYGRWGSLTEDRIKHPVKTERVRRRWWRPIASSARGLRRNHPGARRASRTRSNNRRHLGAHANSQGGGRSDWELFFN